MNFSWQLLKVFRRDLWMFLGVEVVMVFFMALGFIRSQSPESALDSLGAASFLALLLSLSLRMPSRLNRMPFPVSVSQRALLPVLAFFVLLGSGMAAIFAAALFFGFSPFQWCAIVGMMLQRLPFYVLAFLMLYRLFQVTPHLIGCLFFLIFVPQIMNDIDETFWVSWYFLVLPAALALIVFYLFEIPKALAGQDRLLMVQANQPRAVMRDINIESRQTLMTWIGKIIDAILFFTVFLLFWFKIRGVLLGATPHSLQTYVSNPWLCWFPVTCVVLCTILSREGYRRAAASGFGPYTSAWMSLMRITIILYPVAEALGVKNGIVAQCDQCRTSKFIWALRCPHCGFAGPGTLQNKQMARLARGDTMRITMRQRLFARLFIPLQLLFAFGVAGMAGNRPFEAHTVLLSFQDAQVTAKAVTLIQEWVEAHTDTEPWLESTGLAEQIPQKYRLQVVYYEGNNHMSVQAYGLRWDSAESLPAMLVDHLDKSLKEAFTFTTSPMKPHDASSPFWQTRTYLDNKIHWVERDQPRPMKSHKELPGPSPEIRPAAPVPAPPAPVPAPPKRLE